MRRSLAAFATILVAFGAARPCVAQALPSVLTRSFDTRRTGANLAETIQTPARLQAQGLKLLQTLPLGPDARGTEGQPLILPGLTMPDGLAHNVLFSATMADDVYAYDIDTGLRLWQQHVGNPIPDTRALDMWLTQGDWGILSTPVINPATGTLYLVTMTSPTGQEADSVFTLHALDVRTGADQATPLVLNAASFTSPMGRTSRLGSVPRKQRPALLFDSRAGHDTVFVAFGSFVEDADTNQGWIVAADVTGLKLSIGAAFTTTSRYSGGGIWMASQGPAMDAAGNLYVITGNGAFDGITDFSECFLRLSYVPPMGGTPGRLAPAGWFSPFSDTGRVGADPTLADTSLIPPGGYANEPGGASNMDSPKDEDLGSAGALLLPAATTGYTRDLVMGAGKDGIVYTLDANALPDNHPADFAADRITAAVYARLLQPPYGFTFYPGAMNLAPTNLAQLQTTEYGYSHHQHATPVFYRSPTIGPELVTGGENGPVRAFRLNKDFSLSYQAQGGDIASANLPPPGGMPGSMLSLSANGAVPNTCIVWAAQPVGDANKTVTPGYVVAYACDSFANGALVKLWDSREHGIGFMFDKFDPPIVWNGKLIIPDYGGRILVLG